MILKTKNRSRPVYKPLLNLNENIQNRNKLLKFKKKKWQKLIFIYKKKLNLYKKIKPKDQIQCVIARHPSKTFSYQKQFKIKLIETKKFKLAYGGLLNKTLEILFKKNFKTISQIKFLKIFENRLDITLYRSKFGPNIRFIRQLIYHGKVFVNSQKIITKAFTLTPGDVIIVKSKFNKLLRNYIQNSNN
jgi:ribosomal protein S4